MWTAEKVSKRQVSHPTCRGWTAALELLMRLPVDTRYVQAGGTLSNAA